MDGSGLGVGAIMFEVIIKFILVSAIVTCIFLAAAVAKGLKVPIIISYPGLLILGVLGARAAYEVIIA